MKKSVPAPVLRCGSLSNDLLAAVDGGSEVPDNSATSDEQLTYEKLKAAADEAAKLAKLA
jgi:hypothetical protein